MFLKLNCPFVGKLLRAAFRAVRLFPQLRDLRWEEEQSLKAGA